MLKKLKMVHCIFILFCASSNGMEQSVQRAALEQEIRAQKPLLSAWMIQAIESQNSLLVDRIADYLKLGADPNTHLSNGLYPLHCACNISTVQMLLRYGGRIDIKAQASGNFWQKGATPLHMAAYWNNLFVVASLLDNGVNINAQDENNETPLHYACRSPNFNLIMVQLLMHRGGSLITTNKSGQRPIDVYVMAHSWDVR